MCRPRRSLFIRNGVLTKESALKARRSVFSRLTLALTEAIYVYKMEKEWTKALIGRYLRVNDPESLERAYNSLKTILPETLSPTPDGVKTLLDDVAVKNLKAAAANPNDFVDIRRRSRKIRIYQAAVWPLTSWWWQITQHPLHVTKRDASTPNVSFAN